MATLYSTPLPRNVQPVSEGLRQRALQLLTTEISFIPNSAFHTEEARQEILAGPCDEREGPSAAGVPGSLPPHLRRLCESELLAPDQEVALFRQMNYLKFRANALRSRIDPDRLDAQLIAEIEELLAGAQAVRDQIVRANMRLVMSIVKKFVTPQVSFDDLLSDGIFVLLQAVEKFDFERGFRFSTYAYRSIARFAYRAVTTARKHDARFGHTLDAWSLEQPGHPCSSGVSDQWWGNLRDLTQSLLNRLDRREQFIIRSRYALGVHRRVRTFQDLANRLGISKERVRQLEQRAVAKLKAMAAELEVDDFLGAALA